MVNTSNSLELTDAEKNVKCTHVRKQLRPLLVFYSFSYAAGGALQKEKQRLPHRRPQIASCDLAALRQMAKAAMEGPPREGILSSPLMLDRT